MEQRPIHQEVDLLRLLAKTYQVIKKNIILVIVCPGIGLLLGFLYVRFSSEPQLSNNVAQASMMIATDMLSENEANFICNKLVSYDSIPGLTDMQNEHVLSLSHEVKKEQFKDNAQVYIKITATITHHYVLPALQNALVNYFNQSEPVLRQRKAKEKLCEAMIKKLDDELANLALAEHGKEKAMYPSPHLASAELYESKLNYQSALENNGVYVVNGFGRAVNVAAVSSPKFPYIILGFLGGIVVLVMILFIRYFSAYYRQFEQEAR